MSYQALSFRFRRGLRVTVMKGYFHPQIFRTGALISNIV